MTLMEKLYFVGSTIGRQKKFVFDRQHGNTLLITNKFTKVVKSRLVNLSF